jgi:integrase
VVFGTYKVGALRHAQVYFAGTPVRDITRSDCRAFRAALQAGGCTGARRPLKRNASVNHAYRAMRAVLEMAVEDNAMPANPAVLRRVPGVRSTKEKKFQAVYLDAGSVEAMAGALADREPYGLMVRFLAYAGLRAGELAGLDVGDVRLWQAKGTWRGCVDRHRTRRKVKGGWEEGTPKSERSTRRVTLPPWLAQDLHGYLTGSHPRGDEGDAPLFPGRKVGGYTHGRRGSKVADSHVTGGLLNWDEPVEPGAFYRSVFKKALAQAGLPERMRLHDLRHTCAALWLATGGDINELSAHLGHESYQTTLNFYAHLIPPDEDRPHVFDARPEPKRRNASGAQVVPLRPTAS